MVAIVDYYYSFFLCSVYSLTAKVLMAQAQGNKTTCYGKGHEKGQECVWARQYNSIFYLFILLYLLNIYNLNT